MQLRESDGAGRANPEDDAQRKQQKPEVRDTRTQAASPLHTPHTDKCFKQINGRRRQAQNAGAECMKRVSRLTRGAEGPPRGRVQGLTTPMPRPSSGWMQHKRQDTKTLHASAAAATRSTHTLYSATLCVESAAEFQSSDYAPPFASRRQHQPPATAASNRALRPRNVRESRQRPLVMSPLTAIFCATI